MIEKNFLISKVLPQNASKFKMEKHLDASLKRLKTDYLDLYLCHWRGEIPLSETVSELQYLTTLGKIKSWGISNFDLIDMRELWDTYQGKNAAANEVLYNIENRGIEFDLVNWQRLYKIPLIAYSPVGGINNALNTNMLTDQNVLKVAKYHHASVYQILLAWVIRNGDTLAIPQTSNPEHIRNNFRAVELELSQDDLQLLEKAYPKPTHKIPLEIL